MVPFLPVARNYNPIQDVPYFRSFPLFQIFQCFEIPRPTCWRLCADSFHTSGWSKCTLLEWAAVSSLKLGLSSSHDIMMYWYLQISKSSHYQYLIVGLEFCSLRSYGFKFRIATSNTNAYRHSLKVSNIRYIKKFYVNWKLFMDQWLKSIGRYRMSKNLQWNLTFW